MGNGRLQDQTGEGLIENADTTLPLNKTKKNPTGSMKFKLADKTVGVKQR